MNNTNFWDVLVTLLFLTFILALLAGTAYLVQVHGWSAWSFLGACLFIPHIRTGSKKDDK